LERGGRGVEEKEREGGGYSAAVIAITLPFKKKMLFCVYVVEP